MSQVPAIDLRGLSLSIGKKRLLDHADLSVASGEFVLLVGASGTGKSLTLALLAGLLEGRTGFSIEGEVSIEGVRRARPERRLAAESHGVVFQDFALFDEFDARENVRFARIHGRRAAEGPALEDALLAELGLPADARPHRLSGGMKQRLALARALAYGPRILFHDEPTSGLDPAMAERVASLIRRTHDAHGMTTVIVTHDLGAWQSYADRICLLDPVAKRWVAVPKDAAKAALAALTPPLEPIAPRAKSSFMARVESALEEVHAFGQACLRTLASLVPRPPRLRYARLYFLHYLRLTTLGSALPFLALAGFIGGFIATYFLFGLLPFRGYTEPVLAEEFIGSLGFALWRVLTPALVVLLFATRGGAALAADFGHRRLARQLDALTSFGVKPARYLFTTALFASLLGLPILFFAADAMARVAALCVYLAQHPGHGGYAFDLEFGRLLGGTAWPPSGLGWVLLKLVLAALGTVGIAWHLGTAEKESGSAVASGVTAVIIRATLFVLVMMLLLAPFEFAPAM